jgi:hypothetical protein
MMYTGTVDGVVWKVDLTAGPEGGLGEPVELARLGKAKCAFVAECGERGRQALRGLRGFGCVHMCLLDEA